MVDNCLLRKLVPDKVYLVRLVVIFLLRALAEASLFRMTAIYAPNAKPNISKKGLIIRPDLLQIGETARRRNPDLSFVEPIRLRGGAHIYPFSLNFESPIAVDDFAN